MQDERAVGQSRAPAGRCRAAVLAAAVALPAAQPPGDPVRILGFRRQLAPDAIELILACSGPVSFSYSSPTLETIRLVLPGVDPAGVTPPREAWGGDLADVELSPAEGDEAPGAVLVLELPEFRPYSIRVVDDELRVELDAPGIGPRPPPPAAVTPIPAPAAPVETAPDAAVTPPQTGIEAAGGEGEPVVPEADDPRPELPGPNPGAEPDVKSTSVAPALPDPGAAEPAPTVPDVPGQADSPEPSPGPLSADPDAPPPPIEPDFFEGSVPEPPAAAPAPAPQEPAVAGPAPLDDDAPAATRIFEVVRDDRDGALAIRIPTDGRPSYQAFFTQDSPERLVLDFEDTESRPLFQRLDVRVGPVRRVRVGQHQADPVPIVRVVVDLDERVSHRIETDATGLTIRFDGVPVEP